MSNTLYISYADICLANINYDIGVGHHFNDISRNPLVSKSLEINGEAFQLVLSALALYGEGLSKFSKLLMWFSRY